MAAIILGLVQAIAVAAAPESASRRVLVGFREDRGPKTAQLRAEVVRKMGGTVHRSLDLVPAVAAHMSERAIEQLMKRQDVEYVEDDIVLYAIGQATPWGVDRIDAERCWPTGNTGQGVKVAVLDTGIDYDHPDLLVAGGVNFAGAYRDGSTNQYDWDDRHGHGTHCAGIIAARDNTIGVVGVAPGASLWAVKVLSDNGSGYTSDIIQGLDWCSTHGIRVVSMSFGGGGTYSLQSACSRAYSRGVVLVAAAGNNGGPVSYPAAYSSVIAVSAVDWRGTVASWSNYGSQIELAAPGVSIYSTYRGGAYATMSGTSMACPHVAGAAALAWASGLISNTAVRAKLKSTAEDLGTPGFDTRYGYGLADAQRAGSRTVSTAATSMNVLDANDAAAATQATTVSVDSMAYDTMGGRQGNRDLVMILCLKDDLQNPVANAFVAVRMQMNGHPYCVLSERTDSEGCATFSIPGAAPGLYEATVTAVIAEGLTWDNTTPPNEFTQ